MQAWTEFLSRQQTQPLQENNTLCALNETGLLYVGGDDATDFLQKQLSNDINLIDENTAQLSSFSNAKGRLLGIFRVIKIDGGYLLVLPFSILATTQQDLQKFILMSKVILADITDSFARIAVTTDQQELIIDEFFPAEVDQVFQSESLIAVRLPAAADRFRFILLSNDAQEAIKLWDKFAQNLTINDPTSWRLEEIEAGIPTVYPATVAAFVLQMSNLQLLNGVSFKKGCYPGQEVVARMQYLGKLKRRMYLAAINSSNCPEPGDELMTRGADKKDGSGKVVDAVLTGSGCCVLLFIAQIAKTEAEELVLFDQPDTSITIKALPYSVTE